MHLVCLNLSDLLLSLWRGTMSWLMEKEIFATHGLFVAIITAFWPSLFGRPPRNPAEKGGLVAGIQIVYAYKIRLEALRRAQKHLLEFLKEFKELYYRRKASQLHFCWHSIHQVAHLTPESTRVGSLGLLGQRLIERTIDDLGFELKLDSNLYANLSECGIQRAQMNTLKAIIPDLEPDTEALPRGAVDLDLVGSGPLRA
ncbi:hypothetical protein OF83DRAFT_1166671 [Amylostereum chailletii]|nr:hypothetical protein OF83DRAFT_1166671 [Amylostereum chailletii]